METIIIQSPDQTTTRKIADFLTELKVNFTTGNQSKKNKKYHKNSYDPAFVNMVLERAQSAKNGNTIPYDENLRQELFENSTKTV